MNDRDDHGSLLVEVDSERGVATLTLNRPDRRNALDAALVDHLRSALADLSQRDDVRVLVLRGAGPDFCAGADLREVRASIDAGVMTSLADARSLGDLFIDMRRHPMPIVAAVHGRALAGGCGLASACDLVVATDVAEFGYPEVRSGCVPAMVIALLRRSLGEKGAMELAVLGRPFDASEAHRLGLVNRVWPEASFEAECAAFVDDLAGASGSAVRLTKQLLYQTDGAAFESAIAAGAQVNALARLTDDCRAGIDGFLNRPSRRSE